MNGPRITDAAVDAGARALAVANRGPWVSGQGIREGGIPWGTSHEAEVKPVYIHAAAAVLTAAYPHIRRAVIEELAEKAETQSAEAYSGFDMLPQHLPMEGNRGVWADHVRAFVLVQRAVHRLGAVVVTTDDLAGLLDGHWSVSTHTDQTPYVDKCDGCGAVVHVWDQQGTPPGAPHPLAAHQAAVITAAGWVKGREEWGLRMVDADGEEIGPMSTQSAARAAVQYGYEAHPEYHWSVVRRYVTDWEEVPRET